MKLTDEQKKKMAGAALDAGKKALKTGYEKKWSWWKILFWALLAAISGAIATMNQSCSNMPDIIITGPDGGSISIHGPRPVEIQKGK